MERLLGHSKRFGTALAFAETVHSLINSDKFPVSTKIGVSQEISPNQKNEIYYTRGINDQIRLTVDGYIRVM